MQKGILTSFESAARLVHRPRSLSEPFLQRRNSDTNETGTIPNPRGLMTQSIEGAEPAEIISKPSRVTTGAPLPSSTIAKDDDEIEPSPAHSHPRQIDKSHTGPSSTSNTSNHQTPHIAQVMPELESNAEDSDGLPETLGQQSPPVPEIALTSDFTLLPNFSAWSLIAVSTTVTVFTFYYGWNASFSSTPSAKFLWNQPNNTVFTLNLLSYIATVLVSNLINIICDQLRWSKCCRGKGIPFLSFLALSSGTTFLGLVHFLFSPVPSNGRRLEHRWWSLQRYSISLSH